MVGFVLSPTLRVVAIRHFYSIDPASVLVMVLGTLFIVRRQRLALTLGTAVRESTLFLIPFAWAQRPLDLDALRDLAIACLLPAVLYVVLRTQIDAVDKHDIPGYTGPFLTARIDLVKSAPAGVELRRLAYTYGPLWLLPPFALPDSRFARCGLIVVALCAASMTFAYDWGRIIFLAAPVVYVATGLMLRERRRLALAAVIALLAVDVGYGVYLQLHGVASGLDNSVSHVPVV